MHVFICLIFPPFVQTNVQEHSQQLPWAHPAPPPRADQKWPFHCGTVPQQGQTRGNGQHLPEMWIIVGWLSQAARDSFGMKNPKFGGCPKAAVVSLMVSPELSFAPSLGTLLPTHIQPLALPELPALPQLAPEMASNYNSNWGYSTSLLPGWNDPSESFSGLNL